MGKRTGLPGDGEDPLYLQPLSGIHRRSVRRGGPGTRRGGGGTPRAGAGGRPPAPRHAGQRRGCLPDQPVPQKQMAGWSCAGRHRRAGRDHRTHFERRRRRHGDNDMDRRHHYFRRGGGRHRRVDIHLVRAGQRGRTDRRGVRRAGVAAGGTVLRGVHRGAGLYPAAGGQADEKGYQAHQRRPGTEQCGPRNGAHRQRAALRRRLYRR